MDTHSVEITTKNLSLNVFIFVRYVLPMYILAVPYRYLLELHGAN